MATNDAYLPSEYNTGIVRGDYFKEQFSFYLDGVELSIATANARIQIRSTGKNLLGEYTIGNGLTIDSNKLIWEIFESETAEFTPAVYKYDVEIVLSGKTRTYIKGNFNVEKDITLPV